MITSPSIDKLCSLFQGETPAWNKIKQRYEQLPPSISKAPRFLQQYAQDFSEISLDLTLEKIAETTMKDDIKLFKRYAKSDFRKKDRLFRSYSNRIILSSKEHGLWEYDQLIKMNDIPVVLEIKLRKWDQGKTRKRRKEDGTYKREKDTSVRNNLRAELYQRKLRPIEEFFGSEVGYIIILSKDQYETVSKPSEDSVITRFLEQNGKIVPFYTDRITFRDQVYRQIQEWNYELKVEPDPQHQYKPKIII